MNAVERVMLQYHCRYCDALPGDPCVSPRSGRRQSASHVARYLAAVEAGALPLGES